MADETEDARGRVHYGWVILATATCVVFGAMGLARFGYTVILPSMQDSLGFDNTQAGAIATANMVGYLLMSIAGGALASRFGPRRVVAIGMGVAGIGMFGTGLAQSAPEALFWRGLTGLGSGAANIPAMALLGAWFGARRRGLAAGIAVAGSSIGIISLGPLAGVLLTAETGWRHAWFTFGAAGAGLAVAVAFLLRNHPSEMGLSAVGSSDTATTPVGHQHWSHAYRSRPVWGLGLVYTAFGFSYIIYLTFFTRFLSAEGGCSGEEARQIFSIVGWCSLVCGVLWGPISDGIGRRRALAALYLFHAAAYALFAVSTSRAGFVASAILFGLSAWSIPAVITAACADLLGARMAPAALGFVTLFFGIGQAAGPSIAGRLADLNGSFRGAFLLAACVAAAGAISSLLLQDYQHSHKQEPR